MQQVFLCPGGKFSPLIFGLLPQDLDRIEFGAVGRQIDKDEPMVVEPLFNFFFVDIVMHRRIVQDDDDGLAVDVLRCQSIDEIDDLRSFDGAFMQDMCERVGSIIERAKNIHSLARTACVRAMWHASQRPCPLDVGYGRHPRFVEKIQMGSPVFGSNFQLIEHGFLLYEILFGALFFSDNRQRLKLNPRPFKRSLSRSRLKSGACG